MAYTLNGLLIIFIQQDLTHNQLPNKLKGNIKECQMNN